MQTCAAERVESVVIPKVESEQVRGPGEAAIAATKKMGMNLTGLIVESPSRNPMKEQGSYPSLPLNDHEFRVIGCYDPGHRVQGESDCRIRPEVSADTPSRGLFY